MFAVLRENGIGPVPLSELAASLDLGRVASLLGTVLGWGLVTNAAAGWLDWQGYLLAPFGLGGKDGAWAFANLGVLVALAVGLLGTLLTARSRIRAQEATAARS